MRSTALPTPTILSNRTEGDAAVRASSLANALNPTSTITESVARSRRKAWGDRSGRPTAGRRTRVDAGAPRYTERDGGFLAIVGEHGAISMDRVGDVLGLLDGREALEGSNARRVVARLEAMALAQRFVIPRAGTWVRLTPNGRVACGSPYRLAPLPTSRLEHLDAVLAVRVHVARSLPHTRWTCEREILSRITRSCVAPRPHAPDGAVYDGNGVFIAIEVELTAKSEARVADVIAGHFESGYGHVAYWVAPKAAGVVTRAAQSLGFGRELVSITPLPERPPR